MHTSNGYHDGYYINSGILGTTDGTLYNIKENTDYDSVEHVESKYEYLLYYKDNIPYIYNYAENQIYDCFEELYGHPINFFYYNEFIVAIINGDDNNVYYKIADKDGEVIQNLTVIPESYNMFNSIRLVFFNNTVEMNYYHEGPDYHDYIFDYDLIKRSGKITDITKTSHVELYSDYNNGWAKATCRIYSKDNPFPNYYSGNYINKNGDYLCKVDENGYPLFYIKESQIIE